MEKLTYAITRILTTILIILMAIMVLDVSWQVFTRFILKNPSSFTEELAGFLLVWIGLLGASYALYTRAHLGIDILTSKVKGFRRQLVETIIYLVIILFSLFVLVIGGFRLVNLTFSLNQISPSLGIPVGYVYLVLPLTGILMIYYSVYFIFAVFKKENVNGPEYTASTVDQEGAI